MSARSWPRSSNARWRGAQARRKAKGGRSASHAPFAARPMTFSPKTDVILEVASAADPSRASLAAERLNAIAGSNATPADFVSSLNQAAGVANAPPSSLPGGADARSRLAEAASGPEKSRQSPRNAPGALPHHRHKGDGSAQDARNQCPSHQGRRDQGLRGNAPEGYRRLERS